ncbi:hypothetical protein NZJ93_00795 [Desulfofundulus thermocisternus]|nr:hypothetical protein [Desulfofundulus thermocisternus]
MSKNATIPPRRDTPTGRESEWLYVPWRAVLALVLHHEPERVPQPHHARFFRPRPRRHRQEERRQYDSGCGHQ